nr:sugar ABC transporter ATP-binding protein [Rhodococcus sp. (in: high G+C Gram-positive bacteria)]
MTKLSVRGVSKTFQGQRALQDVSFDLRAGEIHCLLGQNGSGKSTMIKILAGYHSPDHQSGEGFLDGKAFELGSASSAHEAGLRFIHQDLALIDDLTVVDNLALGGGGYGGRWWLSDRKERRRAQKILSEYGIELDAGQPLMSLTPAQQTMTAIVRALYHGDAAAGVLVLDEPTASLTAQDKDRLFAMLRDVKSRGGTILYVTHRLGEVFELADRVSALHDGHMVGTRDVEGLDHDGLVEMILGRPLEDLYPEAATPPQAEVVLEVKGLRGGRLLDFSGSVHAGEKVGIVGVAGSGVEEVLPLIYAARKKAGGEVRLSGNAIDPRSPAESIRHGLAFVPGDTKRLGGVQDWTLRENITLPKIVGRGPLHWLGGRDEGADVAPFLDQVEVKPRDPEAVLSSLSGGNRQKVMIARWLRAKAQVFLLEDPTAGVDVGAKSTIYEALNHVVADGAAVIFVTSDLEEACGVCDRIYVVREGRVGTSLSGEKLTVDHLLREMLRTNTPSAERASHV